MRGHRKTTIFLAACMVTAGLLAAPVSPAAAKGYEVKTEDYIVKTRHGKIYVEVARPVKGNKMVKGPAIFTYSPYSVLGRTEGDSGHWVPQGYVRVFADVVGTGNSGGCYDYGGIREKQTAYDLVEWIARQKWSTGKVGMIGGSYEGTTATAAAVTRPPHLTTIVPEAAISRWYGYAYSGGIRYFLNNEFLGRQGPFAVADEGFDTPAAFDFGLAVPPPINADDADWAGRVQDAITPCDEIEHTQHGYDDTPDYGKFWRQRDYLKDAHKIDIPVLVAHNWGDWNVKQEEAVNLYRRLRNSPNAKLFMGTRWEGHGLPNGGPKGLAFDSVVQRWFDHYLMGKDNGIQKMPDVISQTSDHTGAGRYFAGNWPNTKSISLIAQETPKTSPNDYQWKLLPKKPGRGLKSPTPARFPSLGINTESHAAHHARTNHDWQWFETPVLARDTRIFGSIKVKIYSTVQRKWVTYTPSIIDVDPGDHVNVGSQHVGSTDKNSLVGVTRGWLDSRYRDGLGKRKPVKPGVPFGMKVVTKPQDYTFKKGHIIGLNIQTEINEWSLPKPYPGCETASDKCPLVRINWEGAKTRLVLPVVNGPRNPMALFHQGHHHH
ncbi:MAG: CocE/NonD family hydrolase [Actinomycetota bacterium]|nr:CocE/NonD family hydrolase [Actinomycetota bacterium]